MAQIKRVDVWNALCNMDDNQLVALLAMARLMGAEVPTVLPTVDKAPVVPKAPVKDAFEKSTPSEKFTGKSIRMTVQDNARFGGIHSAMRKVNGGVSPWNKETQCWEFSSKAKARLAQKSQEEFFELHPDKPVITEIC